MTSHCKSLVLPRLTAEHSRDSFWGAANTNGTPHPRTTRPTRRERARTQGNTTGLVVGFCLTLGLGRPLNTFMRDSATPTISVGGYPGVGMAESLIKMVVVRYFHTRSHQVKRAAHKHNVPVVFSAARSALKMAQQSMKLLHNESLSSFLKF